MNSQELVDEVARRTRGTASDPLTREDVEQVVRATIQTLMDEGKLVDVQELAEDPA